jgi:dTDP-4-amino-4,6-dideoxygalactose transaminase
MNEIIPLITNKKYEHFKTILGNNYQNKGEATMSTEQEPANLLVAKHAIGIVSGSSALFLALARIAVGREKI